MIAPAQKKGRPIGEGAELADLKLRPLSTDIHVVPTPEVISKVEGDSTEGEPLTKLDVVSDCQGLHGRPKAPKGDLTAPPNRDGPSISQDKRRPEGELHSPSKR